MSKQNRAISVKLIWASTEEVHMKASWLKLDSVYSHSKNQLILCIVIFCGYHSTFFLKFMKQCMQWGHCTCANTERRVEVKSRAIQIWSLLLQKNVLGHATSTNLTICASLSLHKAVSGLMRWWNFTCPACTADQKRRPMLSVKNSSIF